MECFVQKQYLVTLEFRAQFLVAEVLLFMTGEVCGDVGVRLFAVVTLSVAFAGVAFHPSTCINFIFFG